MMTLIVSKKIKQTVLASVLICVLPVAQSWVTPVNMDADHEGSGDAFHRLSKTVGEETVTVDRCDTLIDDYGGIPVPTQCHRRNLVWQLGSDVPLAQWNPELGGDAWRLPTIKELSRLVDYSGITSDGEEALTGQPLILNMFSGAFNFQVDNAWLISSTYRDIDGDATNGQAQIFGINMGTGEIAAFDTVLQSESTTFEEISDTDFAVDEVYDESIESVTTTIKTVTSSTAVGDGTFTIMGNVTFTATANIAWTIGDIFQTTGSTGGDPMVTIKTVTGSTDEMDGTFTISGNVTTQIVEFKKCDSLNASGACAMSSNANVYALLVQTQTASALFPKP
jgi:hypothetical protein